jgi:hypothetical protein
MFAHGSGTDSEDQADFGIRLATPGNNDTLPITRRIASPLARVGLRPARKVSTSVRQRRTSDADYVTRRFNASSAELKSSWG